MTKTPEAYTDRKVLPLRPSEKRRWKAAAAEDGMQLAPWIRLIVNRSIRRKKRIDKNS